MRVESEGWSIESLFAKQGSRSGLKLMFSLGKLGSPFAKLIKTPQCFGVHRSIVVGVGDN